MSVAVSNAFIRLPLLRYNRPLGFYRGGQIGLVAQQEFIRGLYGIQPRHNGCVATIGSFDGVHRGHQSILQRLQQVAQQHGLPSLVIVFEPQPYEYFSKEKAPARLMRLREKVNALLALGVDRVLCLKFDAVLRNLSAVDFVEKVLVQKLGVKHLEIGDDFRFGCDRQGNFDLLQRLGKQHRFSVCDTKTFMVDDERVSSTHVRQLLEQNQLDRAEVLLGQRFAIRGRVIYGKQLGRTIGVPTANVGLGRFRSPVHGVYAVHTSVKSADAASESTYRAVANVGVRPTVNGGSKPLLEVHILDFNQNIYGQCVCVTFLHKIRDEQKFSSLDALKNQIQNDIRQAEAFFN